MSSGKTIRTLVFSLSGLCLILSFQNCAKTSPSDSLASNDPTVYAQNNNSGNNSGAASGVVIDTGTQQGGPIQAINPDPACAAANIKRQYQLEQVVVNGMAQDLSALPQALSIQLIHTSMAVSCAGASIKIQGNGLCSGFQGSLLEAQDPKTRVYQYIFSLQAAANSVSACQPQSFALQIFNDVLNSLNQADSVDFRANGDLVVQSGKVSLSFHAPL